jgi:hypothetical protein
MHSRSCQDFSSVAELYNRPQTASALIIVRIRLSALIITIGAPLVAITAAAVSRLTLARKLRGRHIHLPNSQLDWIVQTTREHRSGCDDFARDDTLSGSPATFAVQHADMFFMAREEQPSTWIVTGVQSSA